MFNIDKINSVNNINMTPLRNSKDSYNGKRKFESGSFCEEQRSLPRPRNTNYEDINKSLNEYNYEVLSFEEHEKKMQQRPYYLLPKIQIDNFIKCLNQKEQNPFLIEQPINTKEMEVEKAKVSYNFINPFREIGTLAIQHFKIGNYLLLDTKNDNEIEIIYKNDKEELISEILTKETYKIESFISKVSPPLINRIDHYSLNYIFFEYSQQIINEILEKSNRLSFLIRPSNEGLGNMTLIFKDEKNQISFHRYKKCSNDPQLPHLYYKNDRGEQNTLFHIIEDIKRQGCHYISRDEIQVYDSCEPELLPCNKNEMEIQEILLFLTHVQKLPMRKVELSSVMHNNMSVDQSREFLLNQTNKNCFLIRPSSQPSTIVISRKIDNTVSHIRFQCVTDRHNEMKYKYDTTLLKNGSNEPLTDPALVNINKIELIVFCLSQLIDIQLSNNLLFIVPKAE